jgi:CheY-like chemotaxis protein/HAMP domain-containing protein
MKQFRFKTIKTRLTTWFLLLTLVPLLTVIIITYFQRVAVIESETFNKLIAIRNLKVDRLNDWLGERVSDMYAVSMDKELADLEFVKENSSKNKDNKILLNSRRILNRYLTNYQAYSEMFIINPKNGQIIVSTNKYMEGVSKFNDEYFTQPMETRGLCLKDIYYSKVLSEYTMVYSIPIFCSEHNSGHIVGILCARLDLNNSLYPLLLDRVGLGKTGETLIVNENKVALNELRWHENAPLKLKIEAEPAMDAANGETGIKVTTDYRGEEILAAYTHIPETGWGFVCKQDMKELNAPIRDMVWNFVLIFVIAAILITLIAIGLSQTLLKPIFEMNSVAQKIRSGDFSIRNKIKSNDEMGSLALAFNNMSDVLESKIKIQAGVTEISETMINQTSMKAFGSELIRKLMNISGANMSAFYILNEATLDYEHFVSVGANEELLSPFNSENAEGEFGNAIFKKEIYYLRNIPENTIFKFKTTAGDLVPKEIITIPIIIESSVVALISLVNIHAFTKDALESIKSSWPVINASYSGLLSNERTRILAESLSRTNQILEAQSEELQEQAEELQEQADELQRSTDELQEQNLELEAQRNQVEEANRLKSEFLSNMSHELRTPLNSINALSQVLIMQAKNKLSKDENNFLEIIKRNGKRLLILINNILDLSKIEAGKMDVLSQPVSINSLLTIIKENVQTLSENKGILINTEIPDNLPIIETDESKLHQVITNIVSNAVKFTEKGSVQISANHNNENILIEVKDTGIGISEKMLPHIFDEFRQVDGSSSRQYEGTGLGLAIASKLIKVLGGELSVKSKIGEGSIFTIKVPVKWNQNIPQTELFIPEIKSSQLSEKTILVVDDDPKIVNNISEYLSQNGYKTITATSGKEALELAEKHQPLAITLDIIMPEMDGWEVLQKLKLNTKTKDIPVIIISVSDDKNTGYALGAMGYINKPVNKNMLLSEIRKLSKITESVMIVDDNDLELRQMVEVVEAENIKTIGVNSGEESIKLLKENVPDVLVLDLIMPGMDGFSVIEEVRKNPNTKNLPVIIVTAKDITKEDRLKLSGKVSSLIAKSDSTPQDLFNEIRNVLKKIETSEKEYQQENNDSKTRILLVEDNKDAIVQMKSILERENYIVDVADGGQNALDYVKQTIHDGIILDLMMPEVDGFEVLEKIRSTEATKLIPVLILTAKDLTKDDLSKLSSNNIQQLIHKGNVDINGLLFKIELMLGNKPVLKSAYATDLSTEIIKTKENLLPKDKSHAITEELKDNRGKLNVLIIEDNPDNMTTIKAILQNRFNITEAYDGVDGLQKAQSQIPDMILLDMSLPKMDGQEVVGILKGHDETKNIPVVAVTASVMKGDKEKFIEAGCDEYIAKPINPDELKQKISNLLKI